LTVKDIKQMNTKTIANRINYHPPQVTPAEYELTEEQAKLFPAFIAARNACNEAQAGYESMKRLLDLPKYQERQTVYLYAFIGKGRRRKRVCIGEIQCSPRAGYPVPPGWQNKVVDKLTPEIVKELE
jgi:hypothetical protein